MDFNNMQTWHWLTIIGAVVLVIGVVLYFLPIGKIKIPSVITAAFGALAVGLAAGIIFMAGFGYRPFTPNQDLVQSDGDQAPAGPKMAGFPGGGRGKGGAPKGKGGNFGGQPSAKVRLSSLVTALDTVVDQPITVSLTPEQRAAIAKELEGLDSAAELKEEDAKAKLEAIQKTLEKDRRALETVGYRWSGAARTPGKGEFGKSPPPNPFKEGTAAERLKSLQARLAKK